MLATSRPETQALKRLETRSRVETESRQTTSSTLVVLAMATIVILFAVRCWTTIRWDSITSDETTHLVHLLNYFHNGDDLAMWELGAPRLPHALGGWASYASLRYAGLLPERGKPEAISRLVLSGNPRVLVPARLVATAWGCLLLILVFLTVARSRGATEGLIAAALVSFVPECLAHSAIAGSDMPFTATAFLALIALARYAERPSPVRWGLAALAIGLSWSMRHTAILLLPIAAGVHLFVTLRRPREAGAIGLAESLTSTILANLALSTIAFAVLWAGDGLGTMRLEEVAGLAGGRLPTRIGPLAIGRIPIPTSALSLLKQVRHQNAGHEAYLCGAVGQEGWATYFPIAFLLKTPTGLIALMVLAIARVRPRRPSTWDVIAVSFLAILWVMLVRNKVNIGVRYALLTYPIAIPFVTRMFDREALRDRVWGPLVTCAVLWFATASIAAHPHYLSSFNEIGGGPKRGWLYLADSNIDWGQDFDALEEAITRHGIREITTDVSSERIVNLPGVFAATNPSKAYQIPRKAPLDRRLYDSEGGYIPVYTRYVAVSVSRLLGLYSQNDMSWLRTRKLVERVGNSIFLFDMDSPADKPL